MHQVDEVRREQLVAVRQASCQRVLEQADPDGVTLDVDSTLHLDSEGKQQAATTFMGGFGFPPMLCFIEPLGLAAGMLRPGGATANNAAQQLAVIDEAIGAVPEAHQATPPDTTTAGTSD